MSSIFLGASAAAREGVISWGWLALTVAGVFCLEAVKNASGEVVDFDSGADQAVAREDRSPFSGGKRVLIDGLLTKSGTATVAAVGYSLGIASGIAVVIFREPRVLWFGAAGISLAFFYHAPPIRLSYRGLGELAVGLAYGPLIACGTYLVQRGSVGREALLASIPLGLLVGAFLWINEFPDYRADRSAGKRTLVVRLGRPAASRIYAWVVGAAYASVVALPAFGVPRAVWLGLAGLPLAAAATRRLLSEPESTPRIVPAQAWTLLAFALYALGSGIGLAISAAGAR